LLHLIGFDEPFGFSVVEAMACGTPVIANRRGSMPELIDHGATGLLVVDVAEAVRAVDGVTGFDRAAIRGSTVARFARATMVARYAALYEAILSGVTPPLPRA
jgi:glycosyltransferase involved in cell wall biosynthesis